MGNYEKIEKYYKKNKIHFSYFENKFYENFGIPKSIMRDTIKGYLLQVVCDNGGLMQLRSYRNLLISIILYPIVVSYFLCLSIFARRPKNVKVNILYEEWEQVGAHFEQFYKPIYDALLSKKQAIFVTAKDASSIYKNSIRLIQRYTKLNFEKEISRKIVKKYFMFPFLIILKFSIQSKFDYISLYIRILRSMSKFESESRNIEADFLVTAFDNGYNALKYYIYKKNGIKNIISIQNGGRGDNTPAGCDMYLYSDYYFSYAEDQVRRMHGLNAKEVIYGGSLPLYTFYKMYQGVKEEYDIILIEQMAPLDVDGNYKLAVFMKIIENLKKFSIKYNDLRIAYRVRRKRELLQDDFFLPLDEVLKDSNIIFESFQSKDSYEAVMKSNVVVNYCSSLGFEAIGMNKKVLTCNYDKLDFLPTEDSPAVVLEDDYLLFEKKLLYLLRSDYNDLEKIYKNLKLKYMNLSEDSIFKLLSIVNSEIARQT